MTTQVLIFDVRGPQYRALLEKRFPAVQFHIGHHVEDVEGVIAGINVIFGLGHHIPPALIAKAKNLKWVQALTTGTETLTASGVLPTVPRCCVVATRSRAGTSGRAGPGPGGTPAVRRPGRCAGRGSA